MSALSSSLLWVGLAVAQADDGRVRLRVALNDKAEGRLAAPVLAVTSEDGLAPVPFRDDGAQVGDDKNDQVYVASVDVLRAESVGIAIRDGDAELGTFAVLLPSGVTNKDVALKTRGGAPAVVLDVAAPKIQGELATADRITVRLVVDDRALTRLTDPTMVTDQRDVQPVPLRDDGRVEGDVAGDNLWLGTAEVARSQYLTLEVRDAGGSVGSLSVFLPSSSEAEIRVQTVEGAEGLRLVTEPTGTSTTDDPTTGTAASSGAGGAAGGRLAHVLWVGIALFAMGFSYLRSVVARQYADEVQPVLRRMERFLDAQGVPGGVPTAREEAEE